jgi:hypothetical protein
MIIAVAFGKAAAAAGAIGGRIVPILIDGRKCRIANPTKELTLSIGHASEYAQSGCFALVLVFVKFGEMN